MSRKILFWAVIGPFSILLTLFVGIVKGMLSSLFIPFLAVVGLPLCVRWKARGLLTALALLGLGMVITYTTSPVQDRFWQMGMGMTVALGYIITALALEEVDVLIRHLQVESKSRLENLWHLDEKMKSLQEKWHVEREDLSVRKKLVESELDDLQAHNHDLEKTIAIIRDDLEMQHEHRDRLLKELLEEKQKNTHLNRCLSQANVTIEGMTHESGVETKEGDNHFSDREELEQQVEELANQLQQQEGEIAALTEDLDAARTRERASIDAHNSTRCELFQHTLDKRQRHPRGRAPLSETERELRKMTGLYTQLREQFEEKNKTLSAARKELFAQEGRVIALEREIEEVSSRDLSSSEKSLNTLLSTTQEEVQSKDQELHALNELVTMLFDELADKTNEKSG